MLGFQAEMGPRLFKRDLDRPAHDDPRQHLHGRGLQIGAKKTSRRSVPLGAPTMTKRISTGANPGVYHRAVREKTHHVLR